MLLDIPVDSKPLPKLCRIDSCYRLISLIPKAAVLRALLLLVPFILSSCSFLPQNGLRALSFGVLQGGDEDAALSQQLTSSRAVQLPEPEWEINPEVERELKLLLGRERRFVAQSFERREQYLPMMEQVFRDEGVPTALISTALIESGYNPHARSPVGAVGIWQFMRSTARMYGLEVSKSQDERKDPILSSIAAARHLRDLYNIYEDWELALAAYNAGPGGVSRALKRAGVEDYWSLVRQKKINKQTARFVPRIIAASIISRNLDRYDLSTMAANIDLLREERDDAVQVARWSGDRRPSAG